MKANYAVEDIQAVLDGRVQSPQFTEQERIALQYAEEVARDVSPSFATFAALKKHFSDDQIVELSAVVGLWCMWNRMVETAKPDVEDEATEVIAASGVSLGLPAGPPKQD